MSLVFDQGFGVWNLILVVEEKEPRVTTTYPRVGPDG